MAKIIKKETFFIIIWETWLIHSANTHRWKPKSFVHNCFQTYSHIYSQVVDLQCFIAKNTWQRENITHSWLYSFGNVIFDRNEVQNKTTKVVKNTTSRYTPNLGLEKGRDELTFLAPAASCLLRQRDYLRVIIYGRHMSPASTKRFVPFRYNT